MSYELHCEDCYEWLGGQPGKSVDLVFGSPPYEDARDYGIGYTLKGGAWVEWMAERMKHMVRVSRGLVAMVVEGKTRDYRWSATPALLMVALHEAGVHLRKPPIYHRYGIPGSGGPDWLRNDYEFVVCCTDGGKLPWSDNTAMGHPPKYGPGGEMSHRLSSGERVNQWGGKGGGNNRKKDGSRDTNTRPSHETRRDYQPPVLANPGNVISCGAVGGGNIGSPFAHQNEAPFPEQLAEFFVRSFCPPGGIVLDPFCGSGTTGDVAIQHDRRFIGIDVRQDQIELTLKRLTVAELMR